MKNTPIAILDTLEHMGTPLVPQLSLEHVFPSGSPDYVRHDLSLLISFLYANRGSSDTFKAYRRDLERFVQWCWTVENISLLSVQRADAERFLEFCKAPPASWVGHKNVARFRGKIDRRPNPQWRPFVSIAGKPYQFSQASMSIMFACLSSFYNFLIEDGITERNPIQGIRQKSKFINRQAGPAPVRRLSVLEWNCLLEVAEEWALKEPEVHERTLFILHCLFNMYLRISEIVDDGPGAPTMGDFRAEILSSSTGQSETTWWFHARGKGNKSRTVSVSDHMLNALMRYRRTRGLADLPTAGETSPLLITQRGHRLKSSRQIRNIIAPIVDEAAYRLRSMGHIQQSQHIQQMTVHWLRHTGISEDMLRRDRTHVRNEAGHQSFQTTDRYDQSDRFAQYESAKGKPSKLPE